ncbi:MAG TPA: hypothetical protein VIF57_19680, partial [Polyangia bacterium]
SGATGTGGSFTGTGGGAGAGGSFTGAGGGAGAGGSGAAGRGGGGGSSAGAGGSFTGAGGSGGGGGSFGTAGGGGTTITGRGGAAGTATGTGGATGTAGATGVGGALGTGGGGGTSASCGGSAHTMCASSTQFCELATGACPAVNPSGACVTKPTSCNPITAPVCGCDGKTYTNDCSREASGISKWADGECSAETCPATAPTSGIACTQGNIACVYLITAGPNAGCVERFTCTNSVWAAPVVLCPGG